MSPIQWPGKIVMPMGGADSKDFAKRWEETFTPKPVDIDSAELRMRSQMCRCLCPDGICEHKWDGMWWDSDDGLASSATCSSCGAIRMSHDMQAGP